MPEIIYPDLKKIMEYNFLVLKIIQIKRADSYEVLSYSKIEELIKECKIKEGDIYDKVVVLLRGLIQKHPFASGNRRTAFVVTKYFVLINNHNFKIDEELSYSRVLQGIRENYYNDKEIKEWIKNGKIREFKR